MRRHDIANVVDLLIDRTDFERSYLKSTNLRRCVRVAEFVDKSSGASSSVGLPDGTLTTSGDKECNGRRNDVFTSVNGVT